MEHGSLTDTFRHSHMSEERTLGKDGATSYSFNPDLRIYTHVTLLIYLPLDLQTLLEFLKITL